MRLIIYPLLLLTKNDLPMNFIKNKLNNYLTDFFEERTIMILCWDSKTNGAINFYINLQSYPPIGALINIEEYGALFKIETLEIQSSRGAYCIARGVFIS